MTVNELIDEVCALGFESVLDGELGFLTCANRALRLIFSERGVESSAKISINTPLPNYLIKHYHHPCGEKKVFSISGMALSFRYCGTGSYCIDGEDGKTVTASLCGDGEVRELINGSCELSFYGAFAFDIYDLAVFDAIYDAERSSVPIYSEKVHIDLEKKIPDLLSLTRVPQDDSGRAIPGASVEGSRLTVNRDFCGSVTIYYKRLPARIAIDSEEQIDIPAECEHLLPLLVASYLWLDDDADKAEYYLKLYKEAMAQLKRYTPSGISSDYTDVLRWC